jgi:hypothetical protein
LTFRPEPRNARRGGLARSVDLRLTKIVKRGARHSASGFIEVFNVMNEVSYGGYVGTVTSSLFGRPTISGPKRRAQLGFRLDF